MNITSTAQDGANLMELKRLARKAKTVLNKDLTQLFKEEVLEEEVFKEEPTLSELMAARGLNEFGRVGRATPSPPMQQKPHEAEEQKVRFVTEFSYDDPGELRVSVVAMDSLEFHGICHGSNEIRSFSWGKVRGLMRVVGSGKMLSPYEAYDAYH